MTRLMNVPKVKANSDLKVTGPRKCQCWRPKPTGCASIIWNQTARRCFLESRKAISLPNLTASRFALRLNFFRASVAPFRLRSLKSWSFAMASAWKFRSNLARTSTPYVWLTDPAFGFPSHAARLLSVLHLRRLQKLQRGRKVGPRPGAAPMLHDPHVKGERTTARRNRNQPIAHL